MEGEDLCVDGISRSLPFKRPQLPVLLLAQGREKLQDKEHSPIINVRATAALAARIIEAPASTRRHPASSPGVNGFVAKAAFPWKTIIRIKSKF